MGDEGDDKPTYPDEITIAGYDFLLVAHKRGWDRNGTMRYIVKYDEGDPVALLKAEYRRNEVSLVFNSRKGGTVAFDFKLREQEQ